MLKTKNNLRKVLQIQKNVLTLHPETKTQCQGNNKKVEKKMENKDVERFNNSLKVIIDSYESKISDLESEIKELQSENRILKNYNENLEVKIKYLQSDYRNLKSYIDYLESQNKDLIVKNENLESDIIDYKKRIERLTQ